jgi:hypothetical protein
MRLAVALMWSAAALLIARTTTLAATHAQQLRVQRLTWRLRP